MMHWALRGQSTPTSRKFSIHLTVHSVFGLPRPGDSELTEVFVECKFKGPKGALGSRFRKSQRKWHTRSYAVTDGVVHWSEQFEHDCTLLASSKAAAEAECFQPWDIHLVLHKVTAGAADKSIVVGRVLLDLANFASRAGSREQRQWFPLTQLDGHVGGNPVMEVSVSLVEHDDDASPSPTDLESPSVSRTLSGPPKGRASSPTSILSDYEEALSDWSASLRISDESASDSETDVGPSPAADGSGVTPRLWPVVGSSLQSSRSLDLGYGHIPQVNVAVLVRAMSAPPVDATITGERPTENGALVEDDKGPFRHLPPPLIVNDPLDPEDPVEPLLVKSARGGMAARWRKRKLALRSPRSEENLEPMLKQAAGVVGAEEAVLPVWEVYTDSSSVEHEPWPAQKPAKPAALDPQPGPQYSVGRWEPCQLTSRDGLSTVSGRVFFASFDQRNASAAGESACTSLVTVIADWLHQHPRQLPGHAEFDRLIMDGSREWRTLYEDESYSRQFPDGHFDLDTVLKASVRPLEVVHERSFVGFFQPKGLLEACGFLDGVMGVDGIWEEVQRGGPAVYIVSWNDHFFVLKVEEKRCIILDTLGERFQEGCSMAFALEFEGGCSCKQATTNRILRLAEMEKGLSGMALDSSSQLQEAGGKVTAGAGGVDGKPPAGSESRNEGEEQESSPMEDSGGAGQESTEVAAAPRVTPISALTKVTTGDGALFATDDESLAAAGDGVLPSPSGGVAGAGTNGLACATSAGTTIVPVDAGMERQLDEEAVGEAPSGGKDEEAPVKNAAAVMLAKAQDSEGKANDLIGDMDVEMLITGSGANDGQIEVAVRSVDGQVSKGDGAEEGVGGSVAKECPGAAEVECLGTTDVKESVETAEVKECGLDGGKCCCRRFIAEFLAGVPLRELQEDVEKKRISSDMVLHHRLQIEFHYTQMVDLFALSKEG